MSDDYDIDESTDLDEINSTLQNIQALLEERNGLSGSGGVGSWIVAIFVFSLFLSWAGSSVDRWTDKAWYSFRYTADFKNIEVQKRPLDCDFFHAPLGGKGCDYEKKTTVFGDEERNKLIEEATTPQDKDRYRQQPNSVFVYWDKKED